MCVLGYLLTVKPSTCQNTQSHLIDVKVKLAAVVEGDLKASFSIATTPRCRGGRYSFP